MFVPNKWYTKTIKLLTFEEEEEENKVVTFLEQKYLKTLVLSVHGSYESKNTMVESFVSEHPDITKISVEKKLKEIGQKSKKDDEPRARYLVHDAFLKDMGL